MKYVVLLLPFLMFSQDQNIFYKDQWGLKNTSQIQMIRTSELNQKKVAGIKGMDINWSIPTLTRQPVIAVIDRGLDFDHPEFKGRVWRDPDCKIKDLPKACFGKNFLVARPEKVAEKILAAKGCEDAKEFCESQALNSVSVLDDSGHGTHISGIIAAANDNQGVVGVLPEAVIMPLKVLSNETKSFRYKSKNMSDYFARAIEFAVDHKVDAINMSVGFPDLVLTKRFKNALKKAEEANIPLIVAAGNNNKDFTVYPCSFSNVICVGAINHIGEISEFSNFGHKVDFLAPGDHIISTYPRYLESEKMRVNGYEVMKGSSMAAPYVTALFAALKSKNPNKFTADLISIVAKNSKKISDDRKFSTYGLIDFNKSLDSNTGQDFLVNLKDIPKIKVGSDLKLKLPIEITNLKNFNKDIVIKIESKSSELDIESKEITLGVGKNSLELLGKVENLSVDMIQKLKLSIQIGSNTYKYNLNLVLVYDFDLNLLERFKLPEDDLRLVHKLGTRKTSFLQYIHHYQSRLNNLEYFYSNPLNRKNSEVRVLIASEGKFKKHALFFPKNEEVQYIIKGDYNLDSKNDYLILTLDNSYNQHFYFYAENFRKLYEGDLYRWTYQAKSSVVLDNKKPLLNFEKRLPKFNWIKHNHEVLGEILIPIIKRDGRRPKLDTSDDLLDIDDIGIRTRFFKLIPDENIISPRVFDSPEFKDQLVQKFNIPSSDDIKIHQIINSSFDELNLLMSYGQGLSLTYFTSKFERTFNLVSAKPVFNSLLNLATFINFGLVDDQSLLFQLSDKSLGKLALLDLKSQSLKESNISTNNWKDPFFGFIGADQNEQFVSFFESRYWIHFFSEKLNDKVEINRESSFPGIDFSEGLEPIYVNGLLGVFINSTLIYGNHLYSISQKESAISRPLFTSLEIPKNCAYVLPEIIENEKSSTYLFNCKINDHAFLVKYPLNY